MFKNKKIEEQEKLINELQKEISDLNESLKKILNTLEGESFSKDWEEYMKYKEMRDKLPDIEEMYRLKRLKQLMARRDESDANISKYRLLLLKNSSVVMYEASYNLKIASEKLLHDELSLNSVMAKEIEEILSYIKSKSDQKEIIEAFKLYGISTEWLAP
jgi:hypothetical protein|tara:strand:+ start:141 stop:620 length:480 start_codon:yes stop_codon:yes gene_type:complete